MKCKTLFKKIRIIGVLKKTALTPAYMLIKPFRLAAAMLACCILSMLHEVQAQDPIFSQFYANPLYLNPALAGTQKCPRVNLNYRNQWPALSGNFVTTSASYDQYVEAVNGGLGFLIMNDNAGRGTLNWFQVSGIYSYQLTLSDKVSMVAGFQATYFQRSLDWSRLTFGDQIDSRRGFIFSTQDAPRGGTVNNVDFSAGTMIFSDNFYGGVSVHHLFEPNESLIVAEAPLERKYTVHAGAIIPIKKDVRGETDASISPNILYQRQFDFEQINIGLYAQKGPLIVGAWYRFQDAFIILVGIDNDRFRCGYSYDLTTSQLTTQTAGSHELSVSMNFNCRPTKKKFRAINCPAF